MSPKVFWIGMVVGLLSMSVIIHGIAIIIAVSDPSFALEPDYEQKARDWDSIQLQQQTSKQLGWTVDLDTSPVGEFGDVLVQLSVFDKWGKPILDGEVNIDMFHNARAKNIFRAELEHISDGLYTAVLPLRRSGVWEFRLTIKRDDDLYVDTLRKTVTIPRKRGP